MKKYKFIQIKNESRIIVYTCQSKEHIIVVESFKKVWGSYYVV
ncbi:MAG: hypothetical protein ACRDA5_08555 [Clostridium sp.]